MGRQDQRARALGRWDEAETLLDEARRGAAAFTDRIYVQSFVEVLIRQGRIAEAAASVRATDFGYATPVLGSFILNTRIRVANAEGRWDDARAAAEEAIGLLKDPLHDQGVTTILELCVGGEADRAELARARRRAAEEAEARRVGLARLALGRRAAQEAIGMGGAGPGIEALLATAEAEGSRLKGRSDAQLWEDAARRREALGQPWETAYARFRQAEAVLGTRGRSK